MKKLFIFLLAMGLLTACNNNPFAKNDSNTKNRYKDDKEKMDDKDSRGKERYANDDDNDNSSGDNSGNWTKSDRNKWLSECEDELSDKPQAKQICSCIVEKVERKYPDISDAEELPEAEGEKLIRECAGSTTRMSGDDEYVDRNDYNKRTTGGSVNDDVDNGGGWTDLQRRQYIQGCETTARKNQAYTAQQVNSYCDCMTRKVERRYSFRDAAKMTAADFQTQEWQDAAANCMPRQ